MARCRSLPNGPDCHSGGSSAFVGSNPTLRFIKIKIICIFFIYFQRNQMLLNDIFSTSLKNKYKFLYFDKNRGRIADFPIFIEPLNQLSKFEYKDRIRSNITIKIMNIKSFTLNFL